MSSCTACEPGRPCQTCSGPPLPKLYGVVAVVDGVRYPLPWPFDSQRDAELAARLAHFEVRAK